MRPLSGCRVLPIVLAAVLVIACAPTAPTGSAAKPASVPAAPAQPAQQAQPAAQPASPSVTINAIGAWNRDYAYLDALWELQRRLPERSGGTMTIVYKGGPEAAPPFEQLGLIKSGVFDMLVTSGSYYTQLVPEAALTDYFDGELAELRQGGVNDLFDRIHQERAGVKMVGYTTSRTPYHLYTKRPIQSVAEIRGKKLRSVPLYGPLISGLGAAPVTLAPADVYSALERGVVDGFMWPRIGIDDLKLHEVTCCIIEPGVWTVRSVLLMNLNAWQKLTPEQQKILDDTWAEIEVWVSERHGAMAADAVEQLVSKYGMQVVRLPENEARQLREIAYDAPWKEYVPQMPQYGPQIQELAQRFSKPWPPLSYQVSRP